MTATWERMFSQQLQRCAPGLPGARDWLSGKRVFVRGEGEESFRLLMRVAGASREQGIRGWMPIGHLTERWVRDDRQAGNLELAEAVMHGVMGRFNGDRALMMSLLRTPARANGIENMPVISLFFE